VVAAVWLVLQAAGGALVARTALSDDCSCPAGMSAGAACPMHHSASSAARCRLIAAQHDGGILASLFPSPGVLSRSAVAAGRLAPVCLVDAAPAPLATRCRVPDPPPPRQA